MFDWILYRWVFICKFGTFYGFYLWWENELFENINGHNNPQSLTTILADRFPC